jgi:glutamate decarboxylase
MSPSSEDLPSRYGSRFFVEGAPDVRFPSQGMPAEDAYDLIAEEMSIDGDPARNLATFVTTWMEPEAQRIVAENAHRNFIDHAEYPRTAAIEQRCIRMIGDLFNVPGEVRGARTQGSSEAIMLGGLAAKWRWRKRREAEGKDTARPNLVYGRDVHVVWDKLCRYFDIEPKTIPMSKDKFTIGPDDVEPLIDENTIAVVGVLGTTFTGEADDIAGIDALLGRLKEAKGLDVPMHVDAASGGFVWPFLHPDRSWDFRLESVRSINVSGHKFGMVYPGIGWLVFREPDDLPEDLVFYENYLGETDATFTLNFSAVIGIVFGSMSK